jgi:hypothetical protein
MTRSKKLFLTGVAVFAVLLFYASYDISKRTSFPGSRPQLKERIKQRYGPADSVQADSSMTQKQKF